MLQSPATEKIRHWLNDIRIHFLLLTICIEDIKLLFLIFLILRIINLYKESNFEYLPRIYYPYSVNQTLEYNIFTILDFNIACTLWGVAKKIFFNVNVLIQSPRVTHGRVLLCGVVWTYENAICYVHKVMCERKRLTLNLKRSEL